MVIFLQLGRWNFPHCCFFLELETPTRSGKNGGPISNLGVGHLISNRKTAPKTHDFMEVLQRALAILHSEVIKDDSWASISVLFME